MLNYKGRQINVVLVGDEGPALLNEQEVEALSAEVRQKILDEAAVCDRRYADEGQPYFEAIHNLAAKTLTVLRATEIPEF